MRGPVLLVTGLALLSACGGSTAATQSPDAALGGGADVGAPDQPGSPDAGSIGDGVGSTPDVAKPGDAAPGLDLPAGLEAGSAGPDVPVGAPRKIAWQREPSGPNFARGMSGTSATDVWIGDDGGRVWHSTGNGEWVHRDITTAGGIYGLWGSGPNNVYAAAYINLLSRWNGSGWDRFDFPGGVVFRGVWGSGPNDVYAVGSGIFHNRGGGTWQLEPDGQTTPMVDVWGSGPGDVWVLVGSGEILHSKGDGMWALQRGGATMSPGIAVWGSGPGDIYVLKGGEVIHSTGNGTWVPQPIDHDPVEVFQSLCGSNAAEVYVGTSTGRWLRSGGDGRWQAERFLPMDGRVLGIAHCWAASNGEVYAVTGDGTYHGRPMP